MKNALLVLAGIAACFMAALLFRDKLRMPPSEQERAVITSKSPTINPAPIGSRAGGVPTVPPAIAAGPALPDGKRIEAFENWLARYRAATPAERPGLVAEGAALSAARRVELKALIQSDPRKALASALPMVARQELPPAVLEHLEDRVNGRAALRIYQGVGADNRSPVNTVRMAEFANGRTYQAYTYGRRDESVRWLAGASLHGIAIDSVLAVHEDPVRILEIGERPDPVKPAIAVCPVSGESSLPDADRGQPITAETPALEAFGEIIYLCNGAHAIVYREQLIYAEGGTGGPMPFTGILPAAPTPSLGNIKVLVIPMTFADQNDTPSSESTLYQLMRDVGDHYAKASYGKLTLLTTVTPPIRLPHNEAWYIQKDTSNGGSIDGLGLEHSHARAEARKAGFDDAEFDCTVVRLRGGARPAGGYGGGSSVWIYGDGVDVTAHEVGHAFGLAHANFWQTAGTSAIGAGSNEEYGGYWDVMGGIGLPLGHYNVQGKNQIRWLPNDFVTEVTSSGLYRIHAQDQPILDPSKRFALKIRKDSLRTYWGELRGLYTGHATRTWADYGLILGWRYPGGGAGNWQLIDTTPGSPFGKDDSPVSLGRTFSDTEAGIHITTIAIHPATVSEPKSVDVMVNIGDFPANRPPTLALAASANVVPLNVPVTFTATARDPDGDGLAYSWQHFGDANYRTISPNAAVITRTFTVAGTYVVSCTASDMKGGAARRNLLVTVGNGGGNFTISGRATLNGQGVPGVLVNANSASGVITDTDGRYIIPNLVAGTYVMTPLLYGFTFSELFNNSVAVGPGFAGADFEASAAPRVSIVASTPSCSESNPAAPAQFTIIRAGDASQVLSINIAGPLGTATVAADYSIAPTLLAGSQGFSTLSFPAGQDTLVISVTPINDVVAEGPETVTLEVGPGNGYILEGLGRATVVIEDDDTTLPKISLGVGEAKTIEGSPMPATVLFTRNGATNGPLAVGYSVSGTAVSGVDFIPLSGAVFIPAGATLATLSISNLDDVLSEPLESVTIKITSTASFLADPVANSATVSIVDDDVQIVSVTASDPVATERDLSVPGTAADTATFLITRAGDISQALTVYYAMSGTTTGALATALHGVDYEALPGVLTIPAGEASGAVTIVPSWDGLGEGPESVTLQLGAGPTNYRLGPQNSATITIQDAGDPPYVEVLGIDNAVEPATVGHFRFSLKGSVAGNIVVNYSVSGTATPGADYAGLPGSVTIPGNGVNFVDVNVTPLNDLVAEELETITVTIAPNASYQVFLPSSSATIWFRDDEVPTLFVDASNGTYPPAFAENSTGGAFYISRLGSTNTALTVNYTMSGTAVNGVDYQFLSGTTNIAAGALGVDVQVRPIDDAVAEGTETVVLTLSPGAYSRGAAAMFYISDDESPALSVGFPSTSAAGLEIIGSASIPVVLSATSAAPVTVEYLVDTGSRSSSTANGVAPAALPYWVRCDRLGDRMVGSISIDGTNWTGVSTQTVALPNTGYLAGLHVCSYNVSILSTGVFDNVVITNLQPGGSVGARSGMTIGTTAIAGNASVSGSAYTVAGAGDNVDGTTDQGYFTYWPINNSTNCTIIARVVSQQNTSSGATAGVMIRESVANNARRGYMAATPAVGFEFHYRTAVAGTEAKAVLIPAKPVWVRVQRTGGVLSAFQSADGAAWTQVGANLDLVFGSEVFAGLAVSAQLEGQLATAVIDTVTLVPGPLPLLQGRTVGFSAIQGIDSEAGGVYSIAASADGLSGTSDDFHFVGTSVQGDFTMTARVTSLTSSAASPQAGVVVRESFTRRARSVFIGGIPGAAPQLVWRSTTSTTANGDGIDFTLPPGMLTFPPGSTSQNISLAVVNDSRPEPDEPLTVVLRNPNGARLGAISQFTYVIVDDDTPSSLPSAGFASSSSSAAESGGTAFVPVTLSRPAAGVISVNYLVSAGTAIDGVDFASASGTLTFNAGDTVQNIPVMLFDDLLIESSKTVLLALSNPAGARFSTLTNHTFTILDDDSPVVTIASTDTNASEAGDVSSITLTRTGSTNQALTINLNRTGTAAAGVDYTGINATAIIPAGISNLTLTVTPLQDSVVEGTETLIVTLSAGAGYVVGSPSSVTNFIADDDRNVVTITATGATAIEGGTNGTFTLTRTGSTAASLTVNLTSTGTATSGADYTTSPTPITSIVFAAGQASRTISVIPINDSLTEGDEAVLIQITSGTYDIAGIGYASVTIVDNDIPPSVFISSPAAQGVVIALTNGVEFTATAEDDGLPQALAYSWTQVTGPGIVSFSVPTGASTPAIFSAPGTYLVRVTVNDGQFTASDTITLNVGGTNTLPASDWLRADIGPPTLRGYSGMSGSNWILSAAGTGFTIDSDRAHAVSRQVTGDGSIVARLTSVTGPAASEAGLGIRDSLHRYSRRVALVYQASSRTLRFRPRVVNHTTDFVVSVASLNLPLWLKLERSSASNTVSAFYASDNAGVAGPWLQIGTNVSIIMDATADYGMTADSGSDTVAASVVFDNLALAPAVAGAVQIAEDFGDGTQTGSYSYSAGTDTHTLMGKGSLDGSGFFWGEQFSGDFVLTVLQLDATSNGNDSRSGILVRDTMDDGPMAFLGRNPQGAFSSFVWRTNPKGGTSGLNGITQKQRWLRLIRRGNQVTALHAPNNSGVPGAWIQLGQPQTVFLQPTIIAGLYCDNAGGVGLNTATFTRFSVVPLHKAPVVDAGSVASNPASPFSLFGRVIDDGLPDPFTTVWTAAIAPGAVTFGNATALVTTATLSAPGAHVLRLWADDGIARAFDDLSFTYSPFAAWQAANFAGGPANPDAAADADPDHDGQNNASEYATGTNPNSPGLTPLITDFVTVGPDRFLRITIPKNPAAIDAQFLVDASPDLAPANWSGAGLVTETNTATLLRIHDGAAVESAPRRFMRLRVQITAP
ncbi:MAG: hypothetical protein QOF48_2475 [Verrucomicrobiota bacterium]|jgi:hypothetical protein